MWMEVKVVISGIGLIFIGIVLSQIILVNMFLGFLLFMSIGMIVFSDIIIGWRISSTNARYVIDKPPPGKIVIPLFTITGLLDFVWANKRPHGKREFVYNKQEASLIDRGDYPIHMLNGGHGCIGHENSDENLNMFHVKYAEELTKDTGTDNLKEIYSFIKNQEDKKEDEKEVVKEMVVC